MTHVKHNRVQTLAAAMLSIAMVLVSFLISVPLSKAAAPNNVVTYQGRLLDTNGIPIASASLNFQFRLYDAVSGGTCLWSNDDSGCATNADLSVPLTDGLFTVNLGDTGAGFAAIPDTVFADNTNVFLEVEIESETLTPRKPMTAAPYAVNAQRLDGLDSATSGSTTSAIAAYNANGALEITGDPTGGTVADGSLYVNPASGDVSPGDTIFGVAVSGTDILRARENGDLYIGNNAFVGNGIDTSFLGTLSIANGNATGVDLCTLGSTLCDTINIGTGGDADAITIGDSTDSTALNSANWNMDTSGNLTTAGDLAVNGGGITTTGDLDLMPGSLTNLVHVSSGNLQVGSGSPDRFSFTGGSAFIRGNLEVDGSSYFDTNLVIENDTTGTADGTGLGVSATILDDADGLDDVVGEQISLTNNSDDAGDTLIGFEILNQPTATDQTMDAFATFDNLDDAASITNGLLIRSSGGGPIATAINLTDPAIVTALNVDGNDIVGTTGSIGFTNYSLNGTTGVLTTGGNIADNGGSISTTASIGNIFNTTPVTVNIGAGVTAASGGLNFAGGSAGTGCSIDGTTGNLACSGTITGSGAIGYWSRAGVVISPATAGDRVSLSPSNAATNGLAVAADSLTSGNAISGSSSATFSGNLLSLAATGAATGSLVNLTSSSAAATAKVINIDIDNGDNNNDVFVLTSDETTNSGTGADTTKMRITASGEVLSDVGFTAGGASTKYRDGSIDSSVSTLSLDTTNNQPITTGTGLFTVGNNETVTGDIAVNGGDVTSTGALRVTSATTNAVTIDSGTTGAVNIGTGANAKSITIGEPTGLVADTISIGNGISTVAISGGPSWSVTSGGTATFGDLNSQTATNLATSSGNVNIATTGNGNIAIGNATGQFSLISNSGLNVSLTGALTGVSSLDTITTSATALGFAGVGTISATGTLTASPTGNFITAANFVPNADNTRELGSATAGWSNVYVRNTDDGTTVSLSADGTGETNSGASVIGVFDEFANSTGGNVQDTLDDLDAAISTGGAGSMWTLAGNVVYPTSASNDFAVGGTTAAASAFGVDTSANKAFVGTGVATNGSIAILSAASQEADITNTSGNILEVNSNDLLLDGNKIDSNAAPLVLNGTTADEVRVGSGGCEVATGSGDLCVNNVVEAGSEFYTEADFNQTGGISTTFHTSATFDSIGPTTLGDGGHTVVVDSSGYGIDSNGNITGTTDLSVTSGPASALTLDSGTTGDVNIATGSDDKNIFLGNAAQLDQFDFESNHQFPYYFDAAGTSTGTGFEVDTNVLDGGIGNWFFSNSQPTTTSTELKTSWEPSYAGGAGAVSAPMQLSQFHDLVDVGSGTTVNMNQAVMQVSADKSGAGTVNDSASVLDVEQNIPTAAGGALTVTNEGTGNAEMITQDGDGHFLNVTDNATSATGMLVTANSMTNGNVIDITANGLTSGSIWNSRTSSSFNGDHIQMIDTGAASGNFIDIISTSATATAKPIFINLDNGDNNNDVFVLQSDETTNSGTPADTTKMRITASGEVLSDVGFTAGGASTHYRDGSIDSTTTTLSLDTVTNEPITTGTGLTTIGGNLTVNGTTLTASSLTTFSCSDCINFDDLSDTMTLDAPTSITNSGTNALTFAVTGSGNIITNLSGTGDWVVQNAGTPVFTINDNSTISYVPDAASGATDLSIDASNLVSGDGLTLSANNLTTGIGQFIQVNGLTTGEAFNISSSSATRTTGNLAHISTNPSYDTTAGSVTVSGKLERINSNITNVGTANTLNLTGSELSLSRNNTMNGAGGTFNATGPVLDVSSTGTQTAGTLTDAANVLRLSQTYSGATGDVLTLTNAGSGSGITVNSNGTGAGLTLGGSTTDITTAAGEDLTLSPAGVGDVIVNVDANSNFQVAASAAPSVPLVNISNAGFGTTSSINGEDLSLVAATGGSGETNNGLSISMTPSGDAGDTLRAINIGAITATSSTENAMRIGDGWDRDLVLATDTAVVQYGVSGSGATFVIQDLAGNPMETITDNGTTGTITSSDGMQVGSGSGLDTSSAGSLTIGNTNATGVSLCNSAACDTVDIGTNLDADMINIGDTSDNVVLSGDVDVQLTTSSNFDNNFSINHTHAVDVDNSSLRVNFTDTAPTSAGTDYLAHLFNQDDGGATGTPDAFLAIEQHDTNESVASGILFISTAGGITNAIDASGSNITNALNIGANTIAGTAGTIDFSKFDVASTGVVSVDLNAAATTNGICHSGADVDVATDTERDLVPCSGAPDDYAEWYDTDGSVAAGDVVALTDQTVTFKTSQSNPFTGEMQNGAVSKTLPVLTKATHTDAGKIFGIVSTSPIQVIGSDLKRQGQHPEPIALNGRIPLHASAENGDIVPGDALTASATPGYAMKAGAGDLVVATSLSSLTGGTGTIQAFVRFGAGQTNATSVSNNAASLASNSNLTHLDMDGDINMNSYSILSIARLAGIGERWSIEEDGTFKTTATLQTTIMSYQNQPVVTTAVTSPDVTLTLSGTGTLDNGQAVIRFEDVSPDFNDVISSVAPIRVVVTPNGPVSLYVSQKDNNGFTVEELGGNDSGITFDWMVSAYRKDFEPTDAVPAPNTDTTGATATDPTATDPGTTASDTTPPSDPTATDPSATTDTTPTDPPPTTDTTPTSTDTTTPTDPTTTDTPVTTDPAPPASPDAPPSDSTAPSDGGVPAEPPPAA